MLLKNSKKLIYYLVVLTVFFVSGCTSKKKMVYFQGNAAIKPDVNKSYTPVFQADDFLSITVMGLDPESVKPFNMPVTSVSSSNQGGYITGIPSLYGYLIDANGMIDFPVIGKVKISGLERLAAIELLKEKLKAYVNNPTINIRILNYKITLLGEVKNPGTFNIPNERITLLEGLGLAGDLNITALRKNVLVIRSTDGVKTETRVDLTSKDLFSSPVYYLHQNDIVYVEQNRAKINSSVVNASNVSLIVSVISLLVTMAVLFSRK